MPSVIPVHPHVRGEYIGITECLPGDTGSSPRAWGIPTFWTIGIWHARFIPTCVGNTSGVAYRVGGLSVHPHVRGEYSCQNRIHQRPGGSSPRAWGILARMAWMPRRCRFIPTCVGNTHRSHAEKERSAVHPHVRGEYGELHNVHTVAVGSSPRAWGIRISSSRTRAAISVHPHVRGEYLMSGLSARNDSGSSPRAWGIRAGHSFLGQSCSVHPHVRGEYSSIKHEEFSKVSIATKIYRSGTA